MKFEPGSVVSHQQPCAACGYDLRGLPVDGSCPECGLEVADSLQEPLLRYSDPAWVAGLAKGMNVIVVSLIFGFLANMVIAIYHATQYAGSPIAPGSVPAVSPVQFIVSLVGYLGYVGGVWLLTQPNPAARPESDPTSRKLTRWGAIITLAVGCITLATVVVGGFNAATLSNLGCLQFVGMISGLTAFFAAFVYLRKLALLVPDDRLANSTRIVMWGIVSCYAAMFVTLILAVATGGLAAVLMCLIVPVIFVFIIWTLVLLFQYRNRLAAAAAAVTNPGEPWTDT